MVEAVYSLDELLFLIRSDKGPGNFSQATVSSTTETLPSSNPASRPRDLGEQETREVDLFPELLSKAAPASQIEDLAISHIYMMDVPSAEGAVELSLPLPKSLESRIFLRLSVKAKSVLLFLTTASAEELSTPPPLGSFVYALPDKFNPDHPLSTPLYTVEPTLEFTSRLAKFLAKKTQLAVYVGNSVSFATAGLGGTVEEEMEAFKNIVHVVLARLPSTVGTTGKTVPNGTSSS